MDSMLSSTIVLGSVLLLVMVSTLSGTYGTSWLIGSISSRCVMLGVLLYSTRVVVPVRGMYGVVAVVPRCTDSTTRPFTTVVLSSVARAVELECAAPVVLTMCMAFTTKAESAPTYTPDSAQYATSMRLYRTCMIPSLRPRTTKTLVEGADRLVSAAPPSASCNAEERVLSARCALRCGSRCSRLPQANPRGR